MILRLRPLLLQCLLLAVCFHAAIGVARHEAQHLLGMLSGSGQTAYQQPLPTPSGSEHGQHHATDSLCAWCAAYATQLAPEQASAGFAPAPLTGTLRHFDAATALPTPPARWAFGNRDPPALLG